MAILNGILKKLNGSAGSLTFKQYADLWWRVQLVPHSGYYHYPGY